METQRLQIDYGALAQELLTARLTKTPLTSLTARLPDIKLADGYRIQQEGLNLRHIMGEKSIGLKMGFTSRAKMEQMGLGSPICGYLTDKMLVKNDSTYLLENQIHPKVELEIVFSIARDLKGKISFDEALQSISWVTMGLEILDSRFQGFKYFSLPDVVADNCSAAHFLIGDEHKPIDTIDLADLNMQLFENNQLIAQASSKEILGHPVQSLVELCALRDEQGLGVTKGEIVLAGSSITAIQMQSGKSFEGRVEGLGSISFKCL